MDAERWLQVKQLYRAASQLEPKKRCAFLDHQCSGDKELRQEVESLLAYKTQAQDFMETPAFELEARRMALDQAARRDVDLPSGTMVSNFKVVEKLGAGGMGVVYKAEDTRLHRFVALKFLPEDVAQDAQALERFRHEAQTASVLNHPHVCTIHEVGEDDGRFFIAMEYIQGETLAALVAQGPMRARDVLRYGLEIAEALEHAHATGIVHRDLKTANVMVTPEGRVKVLDFGLAKHLPTKEIESTRSQSAVPDEQIAGTLPYMAPEVLNGSPADERADIWALGVMLYEMCSGVRPFGRGSPYEITSAILRDDPPPLPQAVPAGLVTVIDRCLAKEPKRRYQRAGEVRAALEGVHAGAVSARPGPRNRLRQRNVAWISLAVLTVAAAATAYWSLKPPPPIRSIAVLPFGTSSADTEYLGDGITDSLIDSVSQFPEMKVISHTSAFHYKGKEVDPRAVGRELGVRAVLTGNVVTRGDTLSMTVELVDTNDDTRLWGAEYTRKVSDVVEVQHEISQAMGERLRVRLTGDQKRRMSTLPTEDSESYELYLRGRYYWYKATPEDLETARSYFEQAIEKDPANARAYSGLAAYYFLQADKGLLSPTVAFAKSRALTQKALQIDPNLAMARNAFSFSLLYMDWNFSGAEREVKRTMELDPNWEQSYRNYAFLWRAMGRLGEAVAAAKHARDLDPLSPSVSNTLAWTYYYAHQFPEAVNQFRTSLAMDPDSLDARFGLANAYEQTGQEKESIQALQAYVTASGSPEFATQLGKMYEKSGYGPTMRAFRQAALEANTAAAAAPGAGYISPMVFAGLHAALGNKDQAFAWLDKAFAERSPRLLDLKLDPDFDSLRGDPRYEELVRKIGLP